MKALVLLFVVALLGYCAWVSATAKEKAACRRFVRRHALPLALIVGVLILGVALASSLPSLRFL